MEIGSPLFMAPELYAGEDGYDISVDVYAYGVLLYQMFTKNVQVEDPPRSPDSEARPLHSRPTRSSIGVMLRIIGGARLRRCPNIPEHFWKLITQCWSQNPRKRPYFTEIVEQMRKDTFVIEGTNMERYKEYQDKVLRASSTVDANNATPGRVDPLGRGGTTVKQLAAGNRHFAELLDASKVAMASRPRRQKRYDFSRIETREP
jgi:serine/threonine protein kinase